MNLNFWIIFLSLLIGAVIGFEFGKASALRRLREFLEDIGKSMREAEEKAKAEQEQKKKEAREHWEHLKELLDKAKTMDRPDEDKE